MKENNKISAGEFKAKCLKLMDDVQKSKKEIIITKRGKAVARLISCAAEEQENKTPFGCMEGTAELVESIAPSSEQGPSIKSIGPSTNQQLYYNNTQVDKLRDLYDKQQKERTPLVNEYLAEAENITNGGDNYGS